MKFDYNETELSVNGVIFFFEADDVEIARKSFEMIVASGKFPTSIVWHGQYVSPAEVLRRLHSPDALDQGPLIIRLTLDEPDLLRLYLDGLAKHYPTLTELTQRIKARILGTSKFLQ